MAVYKGSTKIGAIYKGSTKIGRIYKGTQLVYRSRYPSVFCFRAYYNNSYVYTYIYVGEANPINNNTNLWTANDFAQVTSSSQLSKAQNYKFSANVTQGGTPGFMYYTPATISNVSGQNSFTLVCDTGALIVGGQTFTGAASNFSFVRYQAGDLY